MPVPWSRQALPDVDRITRHIAVENPVAACRTGCEAVLAGDGLARFPYRGRASRFFGRREFVAVHSTIIAHRIRPDEDTDIPGVRHAAQDRA